MEKSIYLLILPLVNRNERIVIVIVSIGQTISPVPCWVSPVETLSVVPLGCIPLLDSSGCTSSLKILYCSLVIYDDAVNGLAFTANVRLYHL